MKSYGKLLFDNKAAKLHLHVAEALIANSLCVSKYIWKDSTGSYKPSMYNGKVEWKHVGEYNFNVMLWSKLTIEADTQEEAEAQVRELLGECGATIDVVELQNHNMDFIVHGVTHEDGEEVIA